MRLVRVHIDNFRSFQTPTEVSVDDLTMFVGKNDAGKSTLLEALDIFFDDNKLPEVDDLSVNGSSHTIRIGCEFDQLPDEVILDTQHPTTLDNEYLLTDRGTLRIDKTWDCSGSKAKKPSVLLVCDHPTADKADDLLKLKIRDLQQRANELNVDQEGVNRAIKAQLRWAIWNSTDDLAIAPTELDIPRADNDIATIWEQLKQHLPVFNLFKSDRPSTDQDAEAQDPMKAAVKEAISAQEQTLAQVIDQVTESVREIAQQTVGKVGEFDSSLAAELEPRVSQKSWATLFSVSLTDESQVPINKRGSGIRRLILLSFFRARAERDAVEDSANVIYGVEEPETSQHPGNQRLIIEALQDLSEQAGSQVLISTHTPVLARRVNRYALRYVQPPGVSGDRIRHGSDDSVLQNIVDSLGVLPDHDIAIFIGVEGRNDIEFLRRLASVLRQGGETDIPDIASEEDAGRLKFIPLGGSSLDLWVGRLDDLNVPQYHLMDRDTTPPHDPHYKAIADQMNDQPNCTAWTTSKRELENYLHPQALTEIAGASYAGDGSDFQDIPALFAKAVHDASDSSTQWTDLSANQQDKKISQAKKRLNRQAVDQMTPERLSQQDPNDDLRCLFRDIGEVLKSANPANAASETT